LLPLKGFNCFVEHSWFVNYVFGTLVGLLLGLPSALALIYTTKALGGSRAIRISIFKLAVYFFVGVIVICAGLFGPFWILKGLGIFNDTTHLLTVCVFGFICIGSVLAVAIGEKE
jgi:hypothetical protein